MEYQKIINLLDDASNQPSKFKTKNWVEINDASRGTCNTNTQIKFKTTMLNSSLCDYSDAYTLAKGAIKLIIQQLLALMQIIQIKKQYLRIMCHWLTA